MTPDRSFLLLLRDINCRLSNGVSLSSVARRAARSPFQVHRRFRRITGETLKQYTLRLQLERAAARLVAGKDEIVTVALASGFSSHEVFTRAFRRHFGASPSQYRVTALASAIKAQRIRHLELTEIIGPGIRFFHAPVYKSFQHRARPTMPTLLNIVRQEIQPQHILFIRRRIAPSQLQMTLGECLGKIHAFSAKAGLALAGWPLCRYVSTGQGLWTIEPAMPIVAPAAGEGEIQSGLLSGGPVALGIHTGPLADIPDSNAAIESWIEANGFVVSGAPWEWYKTDVTKQSDSVAWRTEIYWPIDK